MRKPILSGCVTVLWASTCFGGVVMVTGKVVDDQARPVAEAHVVAVENGREWDTRLQKARVRSPIVQTDSRGLFEVKADVEASRNMFVVVRKPSLALAWDKAPLDASSASHIRFHLVMEKPGAISGMVVDSSGEAVAQATVRAVPKTCYLSRLSQSPIALPQSWLSTQTDAEGRFRFDVFSADVSCDFWVQAQNRCCVYTFTTNYTPGCGYEVGRSDIRLILPSERQVRGRVVEQGTGQPVAGVDLEISRPSDRSRREDIKNQYLSYRVRSDAKGAFVFPGVPDGDHEIGLVHPEQGLAAWVAEPIGILTGANHAAENVTLEVDRGGLVEVFVRHAQTQEPLAGICVSLPSMPVSRLPRTDNNGLARARLQPGESRALISNGISGNQEYHSWGLRGTSDRFVVQRGETVRLEVDLEPGNKICGTVVDPDGKAVPGTTVKIHPLGAGSRIISNVGDELSTHANGRFESACGDADPEGWYVTARCEDQDWVGVAEITGADQPVQIRLRPGVTVKGIVTTQDGVGIPAARVAVLGRLSGTVSNITAETLCDAGGAFSIQAVLPADEATVHRLCVDASGYGPKPYVEVEISGQSGTVTDLGQIALIPADESLSGIVMDANDQPVANVPIFLHGATREVSQPDKRTATDQSGRFRLERICGGPVRLQAGFRTSPQGWGRASAEAGQQNVKIVLQPGTPGTVTRGSSGTSFVPRVPRYVGLTGQRLDQVERLASLVPEDATGKPLLVLFMNQQQRPSRRMVLELVKRMDLLGENGVEIVTVAVAMMDRANLDQWLAEHRVPFKVQILEGDFDEQRYAWGVKSLPWLILTDREHIVRAEGFGLNELDEKIENTTASRENGVQPISVTGLVKDPQGQALSNVRVTEFQTDKAYITDGDGKFVSAYGPSDNTRYFFAVHRQRELVGVGQLAARQRHVEINLVSAKMVSGTVVDPHGKPVAGAQVAALPMTCFYVLTDGEGKFDVGWNPEWARDLKEFFLMARHLERNLAGGVEFNQDTKTVRTQLEPALTLAGTVEDPNGVPIPEAKVGLSLRRGWACGTPVKSTITDKQGRYEFRVLPQQQEYINYAEAGGYFEGAITTGIINRITDREKVGPIILKKANLSVSGVVIDDTGKPVANCPVGLRGAGQPQRQTKTDAQGRFTLDGICSGDIEIWAKLDNVLYGTLQARAGQKNVRLVVSPMRKPDSGQIKGTCEGFSRV